MTKSVTERTWPEWASTKASNQAPVSAFSIWTTRVNATELSSLTKYSRVAGWSLNFPWSVCSAEEMACSTVIVGVEDAIDASGFVGLVGIYNFKQNTKWTWLDEGRAERDNFIVFEGNICNGIGKGNPILIFIIMSTFNRGVDPLLLLTCCWVKKAWAAVSVTACVLRLTVDGSMERCWLTKEIADCFRSSSARFWSGWSIPEPKV